MTEELNEISEAFHFVEPVDRIELLIDYGQQLPSLSESLHPLRDAGQYMVHECQAPVFMKVDVEEHQLAIEADVPREAPIARGFVAILVRSFHHKPLSVINPLPDDMLVVLGLGGLLGMQRTLGLSAIYNRIKAAVGE